MLFFLRKFIQALLLPIGFSGFLILIGIVLRRRLLAFGGVIVLALLSTQLVGLSLLEPLERTYPPKPLGAAPNSDAIVVLSGGIVRGMNAAGVQWGEAANRYFTGAELARAGKARWIVFTAGQAADPDAPSQGAILQQTAIRSGIEPDRVLLTGKVLTTEDEAREVSQMPGIHSVLLVTSAAHMPRAVLLFRARGLNVSPFPTDQRLMGGDRGDLLAFIPTSLGLERSEMALREYYGLAVYRLLLWSKPLGKLSH